MKTRRAPRPSPLPPDHGSRNEYHALFFDCVTDGPLSLSTLRANADAGLTFLRADCGETDLPDGERFALRLKLPQDATRDELRALFAWMRETMTDETAAAFFDTWEAKRLQEAGVPSGGA